MSYKICTDVMWKKIDDEIVIANSGKDDYCFLNATGSDIWEMIHQGSSSDEIIMTLCNKYDADEKTIKKEAEKLVKELLSAGLVEKV